MNDVENRHAESPALRPWLTAVALCLFLLALSTLPATGNETAVDDGRPDSVAAQTTGEDETGEDPVPVRTAFLSRPPESRPLRLRGTLRNPAPLRSTRWESRPRAPPASIRPA